MLRASSHNIFSSSPTTIRSVLRRAFTLKMPRASSRTKQSGSYTRGLTNPLAGSGGYPECTQATLSPNAANIGRSGRTIIDQTGGVHGDICACAGGSATSLHAGCAAMELRRSRRGSPRCEPLECEWRIPSRLRAQVLNPDRINLELTDTASGNPLVLPRVADSTACDHVTRRLVLRQAVGPSDDNRGLPGELRRHQRDGRA